MRLASGLECSHRELSMQHIWRDCQQSLHLLIRAARGCRRSLAVRAWNDDVKFVPAKIVDSREAATDMHVLAVDVDADIANAYTKGGQYLQMKVGDDGKPAYLAIANSPASVQESKRMEFLVKKIPGSNHEDIIGSTDVRSHQTACKAKVVGS